MSLNPIKTSPQNYPPFRLTQVLGDGASSPEYVTREDIITSLSLSNDGRLLFSGDAGGRVSVFKRDMPNRPWKTTRHGEKLPDLSFSYLCDATCHESSFDPLKGEDLSPSVISLGVVREVRNSTLLYTVSSELARLWRVAEKPMTFSLNPDNNENAVEEEGEEMGKTIQFVSSFRRLHKGLLIGASSNHRGTHLACSDENISLLWDVEYSDRASALLIGGRKCSPQHKQTCMKLNKYKETRDVIVGYEDGVCVMSDWRCSESNGIEFVLNDERGLMFDGSILGVEYGIHDANLIIARNAATIGFFDIRNNKFPQMTTNPKLVDFNPYIRHSLSTIKNSSLYNSDRFDICTMNDGRVLTGCYDSMFLAFENSENASLVNVDPVYLRSGRGDRRRASKFISDCPGNMKLLSEGDYIRSNIKPECDVGKKILHLSCSQDALMESLSTSKETVEPFIVVASRLGTLYIYGQFPQKDCEDV